MSRSLLQQRFYKRNSNEMSLQKQKGISLQKPQRLNSIQQQFKKSDKEDSENLKIIVHNGQTKKFHFLAQQPGDTPVAPQVVSTLLWTQPVPIAPGVRKRIMVFRQLRYLISNWTGDQFPSVIYLTVDGISGFNDIQGVATQRVAALELDQVSPVLDDATLRTHDLKYVQVETQSWEIPSTMTTLKLRMKIDNQTTSVPLPLPNPISISFELRAEF